MRCQFWYTEVTRIMSNSIRCNQAPFLVIVNSTREWMHWKERLRTTLFQIQTLEATHRVTLWLTLSRTQNTNNIKVLRGPILEIWIGLWKLWTYKSFHELSYYVPRTSSRINWNCLTIVPQSCWKTGLNQDNRPRSNFPYQNRAISRRLRAWFSSPNTLSRHQHEW